MLQLDNRSPFKVAMAAFPDEQGEDTLIVCVKATFTMHPSVALAQTQREVELTDRYAAEPSTSSLAVAGELTFGKHGTDVLMVGDARAPGDRPASHMAVSLRVADQQQVVAVYGDRQWGSMGRVSDPRPFTRMPLTWERAFGGPGDLRNPAGIGAIRTTGAPLPNLEDPAAPILGSSDSPMPVGFGPLAPTWDGRREHAGTYDAAWARRRAPYLPEDFDRRFFRLARGPLALDRCLQGGESVEAIGVSAQGVVRFDVPTYDVRVIADVAGSWKSLSPELQTLTLFPDDDEFTLTWGAALPCARTILKVRTARIELQQEAA